MTTIAYDGISIACDGRVCRGNEIESENFKKYFDANGARYFFSGTLGDFSFDLPVHRSQTQSQASGFFIKDGKVFDFTAYDGTWYVHAAIPNTARGSGGVYAVSAMRLGLNAREAVKFASKNDAYTGGKISVFRVT